MRWPFSRKKNGQPRNPDGTFASPYSVTGRDVKQLKQEQEALTGTVSVMNGILDMADRLNKRESSLQMNVPDEELGEFLPDNEWIPLIQEVLPYIKPYLPGLIERYAGVTPMGVQSVGVGGDSHPSPRTPSQGVGSPPNIIELIALTSKAPVQAIKPFLPTVRKELERNGIDEDTFKQAIGKLAKAYKV